MGVSIKIPVIGEGIALITISSSLDSTVNSNSYTKVSLNSVPLTSTI